MEWGASLCAMQVITADMSGYTSAMEAQTMLNFLADRVAKIEKLMSDRNYISFLGLV